jgi:hypothetical protein
MTVNAINGGGGKHITNTYFFIVTYEFGHPLLQNPYLRPEIQNTQNNATVLPTHIKNFMQSSIYYQ